jgi:hypothetical protein
MATLAMLSDLMKTKPLLSTITVQQFVSFLGLVPVCVMALPLHQINAV